MSQVAAVYAYQDPAGETVYETVRYDPKKFLQRRPDGTWNLNGTERVPYRLPELLAAAGQGRPAYVVEGEKDADRLAELGLVATTSAGGAAWTWPAEWAEHFRGCSVVAVIADNDDAGRAAARQRAQVIATVVPEVRCLVMPGVAEKGDVSDWLAAGGTAERLAQLASRGERIHPGGTAEEPDASEARQAARAIVQLAKPRALVDGESFVFDVPAHPEPVWGGQDAVAWSRGEYLLMVGPSGTGKSTLGQQVVVSRLGLRDDVLGMAVEPDDRAVLYLALDRRDQIARSLRRMVGDADREVLKARLKVWDRPIPVSVAKDREIIGALAEEVGAGMVVVDSLKDLAPKLSDEEIGAAIKDALTVACLDGVQVAALHHQRKKQAGGGKPKALDDVYGSSWLTAGAGSVLLLWGEPGDTVLELSHLKSPTADQVGPWQVLHHHDIGLTTVENQVDLLDVVRTTNGLTAEAAARAMFMAEKPTRNQVEKARRRLDRMVAQGIAHAELGGRSVTGQQLPSRYYGAVAEPA